MILIGTKMQGIADDVEASELQLYGEPGKAHALLQQDAPHEKSEPTDDYKPKDDKSAPISVEEQQPTAKQSKSKRVEESEEAIQARRDERKSELAKQNARSQRLAERRGKMDAKRERAKKNKLLMPATHSNADGGNRVSILKRSDEKLCCFHEVQEEIREKGLDKMDCYFVAYRRYEVFQIIFKVAKICELFSDSPESK